MIEFVLLLIVSLNFFPLEAYILKKFEGKVKITEVRRGITNRVADYSRAGRPRERPAKGSNNEGVAGKRPDGEGTSKSAEGSIDLGEPRKKHSKSPEIVQ